MGPASQVIYIKATSNNTFITVTDLKGNVILQSSAGTQFKGPKKSTPYAGERIGADVAKRLLTLRRTSKISVTVQISGPGMSREAAVRGLSAGGLEIVSIKDITPLPHNGCKPTKRRRA